MAARLRYQLHDIALPAGAFVIGRGADCQLAIDDPMVSRRHAILHSSGETTILEDLGSRNGVFLNGVRVEKNEPLHDGDQLRIGSQDLGFYDGDGPQSKPRSSRRETLITRREMQPAELRPLEPDDPGEQTFVATGPMAAVSLRTQSALAIIGGVADKALALGRADEAERILQRALADIRARADRAGSAEVDADLAERAAGYAVRLAAATGRGAWVDYVFLLYTALAVLVPARLVDELYAAVRKVKHTDRSVLHAYLERLREVHPSFGPSERFILQRLEGLERWVP
jgi:pSer/pThr/pTyr-binding forkhead associated (FHA) protein